MEFKLKENPGINRGIRVTDGSRTHDHQNHNLVLYQLSYGHRLNLLGKIIKTQRDTYVRMRGY